MNQIIEYNETEAALADFSARFKGIVFDVATTKGMEEAKKGRAELRSCRTALEAKRQEIKAPALERCRLIDAEAKRITDALVSLEKPIDEQIKKEEERRAAEKKAREEAEAKRIAAIRQKISAMQCTPLDVLGKGSGAISEALDKIGHIDIDDSFGELLGDAKIAKNESIKRLQSMLKTALADEAEQTRLKAEREEQERVAKIERERLAAERAENERIAREERERIAAQKAEQDRLAAEERDRLDAERAEFERLKAEEAARIKAEEDRIAAEAKALADQKAEAEALKAAEAAKFEDQREKTAEATHAPQNATEAPQAPAASIPPISNVTPLRTEEVIGEQGVIRAFLDSREFKDRDRIRAILVEYEKFKGAYGKEAA